MNFKKTALYAVAAVLVVGLALFLVVGRLGAPAGEVVDLGEPETTQFQKTGLPQGFRVPSGDKIQMGTKSGVVEVNNFYRSAVAYEEDTFVLRKEERYEITYDASVSAFYLYITRGPFPEVSGPRGEAEAEFLALLGIAKEEACLLNVAEGVARSVSPSLAGVRYPLSFCPNPSRK